MANNSEHERRLDIGCARSGGKNSGPIESGHDRCAAQAMRALVVAALDLCDWAGRLESVGMLLTDALAVLDDEDDDEIRMAVQGA
ncbi:MAG: hypothetical protein ACRDZ4_00165 [Egibacteraceae bacterium]